MDCGIQGTDPQPSRLHTERRVIILGPEGPSFRCCENRIPAYGRQAGSIHKPFPEVPPVGLSGGLCRRCTARTSEGRNAPGPLASPSNVRPNGVFCGIRVGLHNQQVFGKTTTQALAFSILTHLCRRSLFPCRLTTRPESGSPLRKDRFRPGTGFRRRHSKAQPQ
jgi:hypothetical protein